MSGRLSFAAYEGEVMRGAFKGVPRGELEAAKAYGMGSWTTFRRIWLPRAIHRALPTLTGDTVLQLKSTPLVATITVVDAYGVISKVRQATYLTYEPLLLLALIYMILTGIMVVAFRYVENMVPTKR
jgi:polar amino acid transport system permease protein